MDYGKALRVARAISGLQQKEIAARSTLDASYVSLIEKGRRKPSKEAIRMLSAAFSMPTELFELLAKEPKDLENESCDLGLLGESLARIIITTEGTNDNTPR